MGYEVFSAIASPATLIVPSGTYAAYMASDWASYFTTITDGIESYPTRAKLFGTWYKDCDCNPRCHYYFDEDGTGYFAEYDPHEAGSLYVANFTSWDFDGTFLTVVHEKRDNEEDDGIEINKIKFTSDNSFERYSSDYDFEEIEENTSRFTRAIE